MAKEVDQEEIKMDMTPMIDVVFLLIIFFILMPPKKMEGVLDSYLPQDGVSPSTPEPEIKFKMVLRSVPDGKDIVTSVNFNKQHICNFKTLSIQALDQIYAMQKSPSDKEGRKKKDDLLGKEHDRDEREFNDKRSPKIKELIDAMVKASEGHPKGKDADVIIDASSDVPFKVVLSVLNAGTGAEFTNLKFSAPDKSIWDSN